jgi:hypothetical protein
MIKKIKKYSSSNKKQIYIKTAILALLLVVAVILYADLKLAQDVIFISMENEKKNHAQEVCETMGKIDNQANFFLEKVDEIRRQKNYPSKDQKKEIIIELRKIESNIRSEEISYFGFYGNDLSIKFFSKNNRTEADRLFSQIKNLPVYGYRAVESMEDLLKSNYPSNGQLDVSEIGFSELKAKIKSIRNETAICQ